MTERHNQNFDRLSICIHWLVAMLIVMLFISGLWMVDLGYYDDWYYKAPWWHKGLGVAVFLLVTLRWVWSFYRTVPERILTIPLWQHVIAKAVHIFLNLLVLSIVITGYFIVTAKGDSLSIFDIFSIPALMTLSSDTANTLGKLHLWLAYGLIALACIHALAALKHHFFDKDATLWRMMRFNKGENS